MLQRDRLLGRGNKINNTVCQWALLESLLIYPFLCLWVVVRNTLRGGVSRFVNIILPTAYPLLADSHCSFDLVSGQAKR